MAVTEERTATAYLILEQRELQDDKGDKVIAWVEAGQASGTRTAAVTEIAGDREGVWRPVPKRNWAEAIRTRKETVTRIKVEPVDPF